MTARLNPEFFGASGEQLTFIGTYRKEPKVIQFHISYLDRDDERRRLRTVYDLEGNRLDSEHMEDQSPVGT